MMKTRSKLLTANFLLPLLIAFFPCSSAAQPAPGDSHLHVSLISERSALVPGKTTEVGFYFKMAPGWHIYWINGGDSGEPPRVLWTLPGGISAGTIQWPTPQRIAADSLVNYGYTGSALLIVPVTVRSDFTAPEATLHADLNWLVCREICIPGISRLDLELPVSRSARLTAASTLFRRTRASQPRLLPAGWNVTARDLPDHFGLRIHAGRRLAKVSFIPRHSLQVSNDAVQKIRPLPDGAEILLKKSDELLHPIAGLDGLLVLGSHFSYNISAPVVSKRAAPGK